MARRVAEALTDADPTAVDQTVAAQTVAAQTVAAQTVAAPMDVAPMDVDTMDVDTMDVDTMDVDTMDVDQMDMGRMDAGRKVVVLMRVATTVRGVVDRRWPVVDRVEIMVPVPVVQVSVVRERGIRCLGGSRIWNASSPVFCMNCISYANKSTVGKVADHSDPIRLDVVPAPVGIVKVVRR